MECDSTIILSPTSKIHNGTLVSKVTPSWCLAHRLSCLVTLLQSMQDLTFHHVHRKSNALAKYLDNSGLNSLYNLVEGTL